MPPIFVPTDLADEHDPAPGALFSLRDVTQHRGGIPVLHDVSLDLVRGGVTALVGPSGAGKTSLLRRLNRLDDPSAGSIWYDGGRITEMPVRALRRRVGFVFQSPTMFPGTVADNLQAALAVDPGAQTVRRVDVGSALDAAGLGAAYAAREASRLSGGEQQRVALARALMTGPDVLLLDEPTAALDPEAAQRVLDAVAGLVRERQLTVVMITHRLAEARSVGTHVVMLEAGRVIEAGPADRLFTAPRHARTRAYLATA